MSEIPKALAEVWEWKEKIYAERRDMSLTEWTQVSRKNSSQILEEYGIHRTGETPKRKKAAR
jgi:hypothetical protein